MFRWILFVHSVVCFFFLLFLMFFCLVYRRNPFAPFGLLLTAIITDFDGREELIKGKREKRPEFERSSKKLSSSWKNGGKKGETERNGMRKGLLALSHFIFIYLREERAALRHFVVIDVGVRKCFISSSSSSFVFVVGCVFIPPLGTWRNDDDDGRLWWWWCISPSVGIVRAAAKRSAPRDVVFFVFWTSGWRRQRRPGRPTYSRHLNLSFSPVSFTRAYYQHECAIYLRTELALTRDSLAAVVTLSFRGMLRSSPRYTSKRERKTKGDFHGSSSFTIYDSLLFFFLSFLSLACAADSFLFRLLKKNTTERCSAAASKLDKSPSFSSVSRTLWKAGRRIRPPELKRIHRWRWIFHFSSCTSSCLFCIRWRFVSLLCVESERVTTEEKRQTQEKRTRVLARSFLQTDNATWW